jgi:anaerobic ribonucleoside-triphosphate reductase activating protein
MRYAGIIFNDFSNAGTGVCLSFYTQGCPHRCEGCHNPETWDFNGGYEFNTDTLNQIIEGITANGLKRNFCVLGGEPLCEENLFLTYMVLDHVRKAYPDIKIYLWTGYTLDELKQLPSPRIRDIINIVDVLIDGRYERARRDVSLALRGSTNQNVYETESLNFGE